MNPYNAVEGFKAITKSKHFLKMQVYNFTCIALVNLIMNSQPIIKISDKDLNFRKFI